jgi:putative endonuclease
MLRTKIGERTLAAWTYMLRCADGSYYVGCTTDLDGRMGHHVAGTLGGYTSTRRPVEMVWAEEFQTIHDAIDAERRVKGWTRAKKEDWRRSCGWGRGRNQVRPSRRVRLRPPLLRMTNVVMTEVGS